MSCQSWGSGQVGADAAKVGLNYQREANKAYIRSCSPAVVYTDGKRNVVACAKDCAWLIETCDFKNAFREIVNGTFLSIIWT